ncbi:MAG: C69 family dipeptidase [Sphaerochaeta sp.]|nr:C69 family dipeptidase [Sphaerochaeta sp.]
MRGPKGFDMCDTMVTTDSSTGSMLFAKNSDRDPGEPQFIQYCEASEGLGTPTHPEHRKSYDLVQYPRLKKAAASLPNPLKALVSRPSWMWGAEMGINEAGVAIGNEAVFATSKPEKDGLLGMDILRLTLHNASSAQQAVQIIAGLLETFGQGGNGSYSGKLTYHNSFLITDPTSAWVVESAARTWVAKKVEGTATISNAYTIGNAYDDADDRTELTHPDFARSNASTLYRWFTKGDIRQQTTTRLLENGGASWETMRDTLCHTRGTTGEIDHTMRSICMDATGFVKSRTAASMIVEYHNGMPLAWFTGSPLPVYSPFIPCAVGPEAWDLAPHADLRFGYRFSQERTELTKLILAAPVKAKQKIGALAREIETSCRTMVEGSWRQGASAQLAQDCTAALAEEQTFRTNVQDILIEFGAESKSLYEKPDSFYRCG